MDKADWGYMDMECDARRLHGARMTEEELAVLCRGCGVRAVETGGGVQKFIIFY